MEICQSLKKRRLPKFYPKGKKKCVLSCKEHQFGASFDQKHKRSLT